MLLLAILGSLEVGFFYTTILGYVLMTIAFYEMIQVQARQDKEEKIQIKSKWHEWYCYLCLNFYMMPRTWLTKDLLLSSGVVMP